MHLINLTTIQKAQVQNVIKNALLEIALCVCVAYKLTSQFPLKSVNNAQVFPHTWLT